MLHFPNAKINIGLFVTEKRPDLYHNLETIFYPLPMLKDALEVNLAPEGSVSNLCVSGAQIEGNTKDNLVWKAFVLLQNDFADKIKPIHIRLLKSIPMGAGLGGGSADGTFMLLLLNRFFELGLNDTQLANYALQLGSDCPFFVYNKPMMAKGRGEILDPIALDLSHFSIQLICPQVHVSTAQAFGQIRAKKAAFSLQKLPQLPIQDWKYNIHNDFENSVFVLHPILNTIKELLYQQGALYASMSGSGSAFYAIFEKGQKANLSLTIPYNTFYFE